MTEAEWRAATDPTRMLDATVVGTGGRKSELLGCALCRSVWAHLAFSPAARRWVEYAEAAADGAALPADAAAVREAVGADRQRLGAGGGRPLEALGAHWALDAVRWLPPRGCLAMIGQPLEFLASGAAIAAFQPYRGWRAFAYTLRVLIVGAVKLRPHDLTAIEAAKEGARERQADLIRDIFGDPFRPVTFAPEWLSSTAVGIAQAVYEDRAFDRLPILADALQDAGCEDEQVLGHCRGDGPHVRGCWVVDGVLSKG